MPDIKHFHSSLSSYSPVFPVQTHSDTRPMYVKVVPGSNHYPAYFIYPSLAYPSEVSDSAEMSGDVKEKNKTEHLSGGDSGRKLLSSYRFLLEEDTNTAMRYLLLR